MKTLLYTFFIMVTIAAHSQESFPYQVSVTGEGQVQVVPDQVLVNIRVEHTGQDPAAVKRKNDEVIDKVIAFAKKQKIAAKDIKTQYLTLNKNYDYQTKSYSYAANQSIALRMRDLDNYEATMSGLLELGVNRIDGISFLSSDADALHEEARKKAILNAKQKAMTYAGTLGQEIGKARSISEGGTSSRPQPEMRMMAMADSGGVPSDTMAPGEMTITAQVQVVFELLR
ncbi:SIMPL domain-containing protein [Croceiramulus getboli]|nr:SIMPL domain-containing protein [Flavobacteriaceae bacterium YJPT1-3]